MAAEDFASTFTLQSDVEAAAHVLSPSDFARKFSNPILWVVQPPGTTGTATAIAKPRPVAESYRRTIRQGDSLDADPAAAAAYLTLVGHVFKRPNNPFPHMISVGRASNNDLVIPLGTISKLQAYFLGEGESWSITDWHSTNGTRLNGKRLPPREPVPLESGAALSFGKEFWAHFFLPADLQRELTRAKPFAGLPKIMEEA